MSGLFATILSMSAAGAVFIALFLLAGRFADTRTSRTWQYYIWLVVIARLLIPFGPDAAWFELAGDDESAQQAVTVSADATDADTAALSVPEESSERNGMTTDEAASDQRTQAAASPSAGSGSTLERAFEILGAVWLAGAAVFLVQRITVYQSFTKYARAGATACDDTKMLDALAHAADACRVRRPVELAVNPLVSSPLLIGLRKPCIIVPSADMPVDEFTFVAMHELTHLRRCDIVYKWLAQTAVCVHWFNPLVYVMNKRISRACEFACDEAVVHRAGASNAVPYGMTLLNAMAAVGTYREPMGPVTLSENKRTLKERLEALKNYKGTTVKATALAVLLTFVAAFAVGCTGVYRIHPSRSATARSERSARSTIAATAAPKEGSTVLLDALECGVEIETTQGGVIQADFDEAYYECDIENGTDGDVLITCRRIRPIRDSKIVITLQIPESAWKNVEMNTKDCWLSCPGIGSGSVSARGSGSATVIGVPTDFTGTLDVRIEDGYAEIATPGDFEGMSVTISDTFASTPDYFTRSASAAEFNGGDQAVITVDGDGDSFVRLATQGTASLADIADRLSDISGYPPEDWDDIWNAYDAGVDDASEAFDAAYDRIDDAADELADAAERFADKIEKRAEGVADRFENAAAGTSSGRSGTLPTLEPLSSPAPIETPAPDATDVAAQNDLGPAARSLVGDIVDGVVGDILDGVSDMLQGVAGGLHTMTGN